MAARASRQRPRAVRRAPQVPHGRSSPPWRRRLRRRRLHPTSLTNHRAAARWCGSIASGRNKALIGGARVPVAMSRTRSETDSFGPIDVPADRYWGAQTQRSTENFRIGSERIPKSLIHALAIIKRASAEVNHELGLLDARRTRAVVEAAQEVI